MPIPQRTALSGAARFFYADFSPFMRKALAIFLLMAYNILAAFSILVAFINKMTKGRIPIMLKIYKQDFTVRSYQTDLNARMKPSAILEVMQEAAGQHSERLGLGRSALLAKNTAWVLTRVEVDMDRYPAFEETFSVETFPMPVRRCFFPRYFIFRDSNGIEIGRAATLWVLLDLGTRSMTKLDVVKALMPDNSDLLAPLGLPAAVTEVSGTLQTEMRQPRYTDLDFNGHVNNTRYLDWCCDALGIDTMRGAYLKHFAVNFDAEVMPMQQIRTELRRLGDDFSYCGFEGDKRHFDVGGLLARQN